MLQGRWQITIYYLNILPALIVYNLLFEYYTGVDSLQLTVWMLHQREQNRAENMKHKLNINKSWRILLNKSLNSYILNDI